MNPTSKKFKSISPKKTNSILVTDGDIMYAIKSWKRLLKDTNVIQECYDRKFFKKPSEVKRLNRQLAEYNQEKVSNNEQESPFN